MDSVRYMEINKNKFSNILDDNYVFVKISPPQRAGIFPIDLILYILITFHKY
jgi:hypothetical protein